MLRAGQLIVLSLLLSCSGGEDTEFVQHHDALVLNSWLLKTGTAPAARSGMVMVFDPARGNAVLFGGTDGTTTFADTWVYDGAWTRVLPANSPTARSGAAAAWDEARQVVVMFGGFSATGTYSSEVWEWSGTNWVSRTVGGMSLPPARSGAAALFDNVGPGVTIATGFNGSRLGDTWRWNGNTFTALVDAGTLSPTRSAACAASDGQRGVMFGGLSTGGVLSQTQLWNGVSWVPSAFAGPSARASCGLAWDRIRGVGVLYGGLNGMGMGLSDQWEWSPSGWSQPVSSISSPGAREGHGFVFDSTRNVFVLFGGNQPNGPSSETWEYTVRLTTGSACTSSLQCVTGVCAGLTCVAVADAGVDAGTPDAGIQTDAGRPDAGQVPDAGTPADSGTPSSDSGVLDGGPAIDAGAGIDSGVTMDAGTGIDSGVTMDAGMGIDAGMNIFDAGTATDAGLIIDAGMIMDAGLVIDAGLLVDAGIALDAGVVMDAGPSVDAGPVVDAGVPADHRYAVGCSGAPESVPAVLLVALLAMIKRLHARR